MEAAEIIVKSVLSDHVRIASYKGEGQFSTTMISDIIHHLRIVVSKDGIQRSSSSNPLTKCPRGRPRKQGVPKPPDEDLGLGQITRQMQKASASGLSDLLAGPSFTTSPAKLAQKVEQCSLLIPNLTVAEWNHREK